MTDNELTARRIRQVRLELCNNDNTQFAHRIGKSRQHASALCNGKIGIGKQTLELILQAFPVVNREWLYFGNGSMLNEQADATPVSQPDIYADIADTLAHLSHLFNALSLCASKSAL